MDARTLVAYNHEARQRLATFFVDQVPWDVLKEDHGTSHHNIADVFVHGCNMEDWYLHHVLAGKAWAGPAYDGFADASSVQERVLEVQAKTETLLDGLPDDAMTVVHELDTGGDEPLHLSLEDLLVEVVSEDVHHRGEIIAMLWRKDIEPPYVAFAAWAAARRN